MKFVLSSIVLVLAFIPTFVWFFLKNFLNPESFLQKALFAVLSLWLVWLQMGFIIVGLFILMFILLNGTEK